MSAELDEREMQIAREAARLAARAVNDRLDTMQLELTANTSLTREMRDLLELGKAGFRVLGYLGTIARWLGYIGAGAVAVYTLAYMATHGGRPPEA